MNDLNKIIEIDISKQARALALLRLTDYALVIGCGFGAMGIVLQLVVGWTSTDAGTKILYVVMLPIFSFAAFTGSRHVGVIDPKVWLAYRVVFPMLIVFLSFILLDSLLNFGSLGETFNQGRRAEAIQQLSGMSGAIWIISVAVLGWISLFALRKLKIVGLGFTVEEVMFRLARKAGSQAEFVAHIKPINKPRGLALGAAGVLVLLTVMIGPLFSNKAFVAEAWLRITNELTLLGFFLLVRARRYFQVDADSLLAVDRRPPILFLRSFDDDEKQIYLTSRKALLDFSLETRFSNHFSHFGPFIGIGSPKETVPQLGAARVLLSDDEWQPRVLGWMREAQLIVMYSGKTHWVNWELRQVLNSGYAGRLILMIPEIKLQAKKRAEEISARVAHIREVFRGTPWEEELSQFDDFTGLRAMLFRPDGSMVVVKSRSHRRDAYHLSALVAHQLLLDPTGATISATQVAPKAGTLKFWLAGTIAAIAVATALIFVSAPNYGDKLTFGKGELYYKDPVSLNDARRVGEYLQSNGYFSDKTSASVLLTREQGGYKLRFVVDPHNADDPLNNIVFGMMGSEIARNGLAGAPIEVALVDENLMPIKVVPLCNKLMFGKSGLYFSDPVTPVLAGNIGRQLVEIGVFNDQKGGSAFVSNERDGYHLRFVVNSSSVHDPKIRTAFTQIGQMVAVQALGGTPLTIHLCDDKLNCLTSDRIEPKVNTTIGP